MSMKQAAQAFKPWGIILGALFVGLQLISRLDDLLVRHLDNTFATKADVAKVEDKVDTVLRRLDTIKNNNPIRSQFANKDRQ